MEENKEVINEETQKEENKPREFRGLYKYVKISVKTLDRIIVGCIAVIVILVALDLRNPGFTITFDSRGGSDISPQNQMYGELLSVPEDPTRDFPPASPSTWTLYNRNSTGADQVNPC